MKNYIWKFLKNGFAYNFGIPCELCGKIIKPNTPCFSCYSKYYITIYACGSHEGILMDMWTEMKRKNMHKKKGGDSERNELEERLEREVMRKRIRELEKKYNI